MKGQMLINLVYFHLVTDDPRSYKCFGTVTNAISVHNNMPQNCSYIHWTWLPMEGSKKLSALLGCRK